MKFLKVKKLVVNPITTTAKGNGWNMAKSKHSSISISTDGLSATNNSNADGWRTVRAERGYNISAVDSSAVRPAVIHYFEVAIMSLHSYKQ
jgi:hypothetical protein